MKNSITDPRTGDLRCDSCGLLYPKGVEDYSTFHYQGCKYKSDYTHDTTTNATIGTRKTHLDQPNRKERRIIKALLKKK